MPVSISQAPPQLFRPLSDHLSQTTRTCRMLFLRTRSCLRCGICSSPLSAVAAARSHQPRNPPTRDEWGFGLQPCRSIEGDGHISVRGRQAKWRPSSTLKPAGTMMRIPVQLITVSTMLAGCLQCSGQTSFRDEPVDWGTVRFVMPNVDRQTFEAGDLGESLQELADSIAQGFAEELGDALARAFGGASRAPAGSKPDRVRKAANPARPAAPGNPGDSPRPAISSGVLTASGISANGIEYSIALVDDGHEALAEITGAPAIRDAGSARIRHRITQRGIESASGARIYHLKARRLFGFSGASFSTRQEGRTAWTDLFLMDGKLLMREALLPAGRSTPSQRAEYVRFLNSFRRGSQQ